MLQAHHSEEARPLNLVRPEVPAELAAVVAKMMAKEPSRRYQTPAEVAQALKPFLKPAGLTSPQPELSRVATQIERPSSVPIVPTPTPDEDEAPFFEAMEPVEPVERWKTLLDTPSLDPSSASRSAIRKAPRRQPLWLWPTVAVAVLTLGLLIAWAGGLFKFATPEGTVVLQDLPDNAQVFVDGQKVTVRFAGGGEAQITVPAGKRVVEVKKDGFVARGEEVTIAAGDKILFKARLEPLPKKMTGEAPDEVSIFEPKDILSPRPLLGNQPKPADLLVAPFDEAAAKAAQEKWATKLGLPVVRPNTIGMPMTLIPPGRFEMGSRESVDQLRSAFPTEAASANFGAYGEWPLHTVTITKPFFLGKYEVTKREFKQFVDEDGYRTDAEKDGRRAQGYAMNADVPVSQESPNYTWRNWGPEQPDDAPVVNVSYNDANEFCAWLSRKEGRTYRLPTEAEWEYACRTGTMTRYYNGDDPEGLTTIGNVRDVTWLSVFKNEDGQAAIHSSDGYTFPSPVGKFQPNHFGLYDMIGNAWEFCADWYNEDYYRHSPSATRLGRQQAKCVCAAAGLGRPVGYDAELQSVRRSSLISDFGTAVFGSRLSVDSGVAESSATLVNPVRESRPTLTAGNSNDGFVRLFKGKDLSGWTAIENDGSWTVDDQGVFIGQGSRQEGKPLILIADHAIYKDFRLAVRILNDEGAALRAIIRRSAFGSRYSGYGIATTELRTATSDTLHRGSIHRADMLPNGVSSNGR